MKYLILFLLLGIISVTCVGEPTPSLSEVLLCLKVDAPPGQKMRGMEYPLYITVRNDGAFVSNDAEAEPPVKNMDKYQIEIVRAVTDTAKGFTSSGGATTFVVKYTQSGVDRDYMAYEYRIPCALNSTTGQLTFGDDATFSWCAKNPISRCMTTVDDYSPLLAGLRFKITVLKNTLKVK